MLLTNHRGNTMFLSIPTESTSPESSFLYGITTTITPNHQKKLIPQSSQINRLKLYAHPQQEINIKGQPFFHRRTSKKSNQHVSLAVNPCFKLVKPLLQSEAGLLHLKKSHQREKTKNKKQKERKQKEENKSNLQQTQKHKPPPEKTYPSIQENRQSQSLELETAFIVELIFQSSLFSFLVFPRSPSLVTLSVVTKKRKKKISVNFLSLEMGFSLYPLSCSDEEFGSICSDRRV